MEPRRSQRVVTNRLRELLTCSRPRCGRPIGESRFPTATVEDTPLLTDGAAVLFENWVTAVHAKLTKVWNRGSAASRHLLYSRLAGCHYPPPPPHHNRQLDQSGVTGLYGATRPKPFRPNLIRHLMSSVKTNTGKCRSSRVRTTRSTMKKKKKKAISDT